MSKRWRRFWNEHNLSIVTAGILGTWILAYALADQNRHWGAFFGNAIADWSGVVLMVLGTKYLMERGSRESKRQYDRKDSGIRKALKEHSFSIFVVITLGGWILLFNHLDPNAKWGQVVGNLVSEWTQALGLIFLTKRLRERGSEESK
ncbi:MAG TPA: hypothetical protein VFN49_03405 [Candidatus Aquilonibacter sp.]|nr:hypothetical protein [Candidatus Aquilonibacter sp.]